MALRDVQTCFVTCRKSFSEDALQFFSRGRRGRRNTFATFSEDALQFLWQASTLDVSIVFLRGRHSTLDVSCCVFFANRIVSQGCVKWRQGANSVAGVAFCEM